MSVSRCTTTHKDDKDSHFRSPAEKFALANPISSPLFPIYVLYRPLLPVRVPHHPGMTICVLFRVHPPSLRITAHAVPRICLNHAHTPIFAHPYRPSISPRNDRSNPPHQLSITHKTKTFMLTTNSQLVTRVMFFFSFFFCGALLVSTNTGLSNITHLASPLPTSHQAPHSPEPPLPCPPIVLLTAPNTTTIICSRVSSIHIELGKLLHGVLHGFTQPLQHTARRPRLSGIPSSTKRTSIRHSIKAEEHIDPAFHQARRAALSSIGTVLILHNTPAIGIREPALHYRYRQGSSSGPRISWIQ